MSISSGARAGGGEALEPWLVEHCSRTERPGLSLVVAAAGVDQDSPAADSAAASCDQRYEELWRELILCDDLGFDFSFCVEHHCRPDESWISSPSLYAVGAGARTKRMRIGPMGYIVPLYHPLRLAEEIAIVDQMLGGRMECGLVPGINPDYFRPFGLDYGQRKTPTLEFVDYLRAAYGETQPYTFKGENFQTAEPTVLSVQPVQKPHPPLWMMSRDPQTLEFCARNGINSRLFPGLSARRRGAALP